MPNYYPIREDLARRAKEMMSFSDYREGSATAEYQAQVDEAAAIAEARKGRVDPMYHGKIDALLDAYAQKLAETINRDNEIGTRCPSVLISGGSNFPVRKKEKQIAAWDRNRENWDAVNAILKKIRSVGTGGISADDPNALDKLKSKLANLEALQEHMKAVNAYYRKHKTLDGCPGLSEKSRENLKNGMTSWHGDKPYPTWALSNNNAEIRRISGRIAELERRESSPAPEGWTFDGGEVVMDITENRLQVLFDEKPDADLRAELKRNGFRWAPSQGAWQRQLTDNAIRTAKWLNAIAPTD